MATHQVNRVAALAVAAAEFLAYGEAYMAQIVSNAKALGRALQERGFFVLGAHKGYTETHQVIVDAQSLGGGYEASNQLARATIITNKNLIPSDRADDWDFPGGIRLGTTEVTRLNMKEPEMAEIADLMAAVLLKRQPTDAIRSRVRALRADFQHLHYCFEV